MEGWRAAAPGLPARRPRQPGAAARAPVFDPAAGAPGTEVTVRMRDLPALTPVHLGLGATRASFEVLASLVTTRSGTLAEVVRVPAWATSDRAHHFVLVDVYFRPLAVSAPFHVTGADGTLTRRGRVVAPSAGCLGLRDDGDTPDVYGLTGELAGVEPGTEVLVRGTVVEPSPCGRRTTLHVTHVERP